MKHITISLALAAGLVASAASASVTVYSDRPTWTAAAGPILGTEEFEDMTFINGLAISKGFLDGGQWFDVIDDPTHYSFNPVTAVGFDLDMGPGGFGSGIIFTVHYVGGATEVLAEINDYVGFYGIVSTMPFDKLTFSLGTLCCVETYTLDNMTFAAIPEPGTWAMLIAGFGLVGTAVRRRRDLLAA